LIDLTLINTTARVKINNEYTKEMKTDARVKQGKPLSATLCSCRYNIKAMRSRRQYIYTLNSVLHMPMMF